MPAAAFFGASRLDSRRNRQHPAFSFRKLPSAQALSEASTMCLKLPSEWLGQSSGTIGEY